ncbi:complex I NDUFA9 subunit family protein [Telmatospirillum siberiense]|uniref:Complex I NDUFA9 subunit family protein n=1 Tax=Telmatospirillum siberiense TaxID=382514 RepID=A0A2N3PSQ3_9PROT|nr:complex I NDUFA9 subunit family protein [Telmatospirillum siberiense]PKU23429.1 complex I NDUFA9 subunit family protein [Telmatospirillum siberiense]
MPTRLATVFGGTGFIGRHLVQHLASRGWRVRVAVRDPDGAGFLRPLGDVSQVVPVFAEITDEASTRAAVEGAQWVFNAVGILTEHGRSNFENIHLIGARNVATAAKAAGAKTLVHISAVGADSQSASAYARSKAAGEAAVRAAFPDAVILRPSVVFGPEDDFINRFASLSSFSPVLPVFVTDGHLFPSGQTGDCPLFGTGGTKLQPVYVGDVAGAALAAASSPDHAGKTFELGGPQVVSLKQLLELILATIGRRRLLIPLPLSVARLQALLMRVLPNPPLTTDQVKLLAKDNVVGQGVPGLADLGVVPTALESIIPGYLGRFRNPYAPVT